MSFCLILYHRIGLDTIYFIIILRKWFSLTQNHYESHISIMLFLTKTVLQPVVVAGTDTVSQS